MWLWIVMFWRWYGWWYGILLLLLLVWCLSWIVVWLDLDGWWWSRLVVFLGCVGIVLLVCFIVVLLCWLVWLGWIIGWFLLVLGRIGLVEIFLFWLWWWNVSKCLLVLVLLWYGVVRSGMEIGCFWWKCLVILGIELLGRGCWCGWCCYWLVFCLGSSCLLFGWLVVFWWVVLGCLDWWLLVLCVCFFWCCCCVIRNWLVEMSWGWWVFRILLVVVGYCWLLFLVWCLWIVIGRCRSVWFFYWWKDSSVCRE